MGHFFCFHNLMKASIPLWFQSVVFDGEWPFPKCFCYRIVSTENAKNMNNNKKIMKCQRKIEAFFFFEIILLYPKIKRNFLQKCIHSASCDMPPI